MVDTTSIRILLIEDNPDVARYITNHLKPAGYNVHWADNPTDALELLRSERCIAVLVLDMSSIAFDGMSLLKELRAQGNTTAVLGLSSDSSARSSVNGLNAGADDFLQIPFHISELQARIRALSRRTKRQR